MSVQNYRRRAEMETNPVSQRAIVVHHIIEVAVIVIIGVVSVLLGLKLVLYVVSTIFPLPFFLLIWIASKYFYQDLRRLFFHFNPIICTMWFMTVFPIFFTSGQGLGMYIHPYSDTVTIITGVLSLGLAIFAVYGLSVLFDRDRVHMRKEGVSILGQKFNIMRHIRRRRKPSNNFHINQYPAHTEKSRHNARFRQNDLGRNTYYERSRPNHYKQEHTIAKYCAQCKSYSHDSSVCWYRDFVRHN